MAIIADPKSPKSTWKWGEGAAAIVCCSKHFHPFKNKTTKSPVFRSVQWTLTSRSSVALRRWTSRSSCVPSTSTGTMSRCWPSTRRTPRISARALLTGRQTLRWSNSTSPSRRRPSLLAPATWRSVLSALKYPDPPIPWCLNTHSILSPQRSLRRREQESLQTSPKSSTSPSQAWSALRILAQEPSPITKRWCTSSPATIRCSTWSTTLRWACKWYLQSRGPAESLLSLAKPYRTHPQNLSRFLLWLLVVVFRTLMSPLGPIESFELRFHG